MPSSILTAFDDFPDEGALVGRILAGYSQLEIDLMHCASAVRGDLNGALRTMFSARGNAARIKFARGFSRLAYEHLKLGAELDAATDAAYYCLEIRNMYAHCTWWNDRKGLAFASLEELAKGKAVVTDLRGLTVHHATVAHLESQLRYFENTDNMILGLIHEGNRRSGKPNLPNIQLVPPIAKPPLTIP